MLAWHLKTMTILVVSCINTERRWSGFLCLFFYQGLHFLLFCVVDLICNTRANKQVKINDALTVQLATNDWEKIGLFSYVLRSIIF